MAALPFLSLASSQAVAPGCAILAGDGSYQVCCTFRAAKTGRCAACPITIHPTSNSTDPKRCKPCNGAHTHKACGPQGHYGCY